MRLQQPSLTGPSQRDGFHFFHLDKHRGFHNEGAVAREFQPEQTQWQEARSFADSLPKITMRDSVGSVDISPITPNFDPT